MAAARFLAAAGVERRHIATRQLWGMDLDPSAVAIAGDGLARWASLGAAEERELRAHLVCGDALEDHRATWASAGAPDGRFDVVLGNPPFQGQLRNETGRTRAEVARLRSRFGDEVGPYTDTSAVFLLMASMLVRPGGRVGMVLPQSVLVTRDARELRHRIAREMVLEHLWWSAEKVFDAAVRVWAAVLRRRTGDDEEVEGPLTRSSGVSFGRAEPLWLDREELRDAPTWGTLVADLVGVPPVTLEGAGTLGEVCDATAGFRDQFYGLAPHVVDEVEASDEHFPKLVTCGLIDPGLSLWGERAARFAGRRWKEPRVNLASVRSSDPALHRWVVARLRPKVVVATQTRVVEAAVDVDGSWVPSTPTIAVAPEVPEDLWAVAAVLMSPAVTAWALSRYGGAALAAGHIKLSARDILTIPLPRDRETLGAAASVLAGMVQADPLGVRSALLEAGRLTCRAFGVDEGIWAWWAERLPSRGSR